VVRLEELKRRLTAPGARVAMALIAPTVLAFVVDVGTRGATLVDVAGASYLASIFLSLAFWSAPLWAAAAIRSSVFRVALWLAWLGPFSIFVFAGQALHHRIFHVYMARDTVRFGMSQRATLGAWFAAVGGVTIFLVLGGIGAALAFAFLRGSRAITPMATRTRSLVPVAAFSIAVLVLWNDGLETRGIQRALPDVCFVHGVVSAVREASRGRSASKRDITVRTPVPLPPLQTPAHRPNVLLIITESVRADAWCSEASPACASRFLDAVAADRVGLGRLTAQSPGTVSSCTALWTGIGPEADFTTVHATPTLWELAHAVGYRTAYVSAQNLKNADFGAFLARAGIDVRVSGLELGGSATLLVGGEDERATARTLAFVREVPDATPWFAVTHLSNTHSPYRTVPELEPNTPQSMWPLGGVEPLHNRYKNAVLLQERTVAELVSELRKMPRWDDTVVLFVSDHGEQFGEHGGLYHLFTVFEEEIRVPGFLVAGPHVLSEDQLAALRTFARKRTFLIDVTATIVDLIGLADQRPKLPFGDRMRGRSLLQPRPAVEPTAFLSTASAVWQPDTITHGYVQGDRVLVESKGGNRACYDLTTDPAEKKPLPPAACGALDELLSNAPW
jgi:glucan phosphoethanolaminetransferase (alkaline phosphatase superfamily)